MNLRWLATLVAIFPMLVGVPASAGPVRLPIFGVWMITKARIAPWASDREPALASRRLLQRKLIFFWNAIDGPPPLGCDNPGYRTVEMPAEGLFQGNLTSPVLQAHMLGFPLGPVTTLQTDCEGAIDFHFVDRSTAMFALDNVIYTIRRR